MRLEKNKTEAMNALPTEINSVPAVSSAWQLIQKNLQLKPATHAAALGLVKKYEAWYGEHPAYTKRMLERSTKYLAYVVNEVNKRKMPSEIALLPMIESAYNPQAYSHAHAAGLWQFIPSTGRYFNLRQTNWYDGRRDVMASTDAAISYLSRLKEMFNGDWLLALAAYNAGEGRVSRAIERNQKLGLPTDYWNLSLPTETQNYVPKLLALSQVVMTPQAYGVSLAPVANEPYFEQVEFKQHMDLARVAAMAGLDEDELYLLNPAFKKGITLDGPQHLLVPTDKAEQLTANLSQMKPQEMVQWQQYHVRSGDSLHSIANRHQVTVSTLKDLNKLSSSHLRIGQVLSIPGQPVIAARETLHPLTTAQRTQQRTYRVKSGDSLWQIAKHHQVAVKDVRRWNKLSGNSLQIGQVLTLQAGKTSKTRQGATYYKVRQGDSLYLIAKRLKVPMKTLQNWNPKAGKAIKPGQTLTLYSAN